MKKLLVAFVAVVAVSFASCVNGNTKAETKEDSAVAEPVVEEVVEDTAAADTTAADTTAVVAE